MMYLLCRGSVQKTMKKLFAAVFACSAGVAQAYQFETSPDWVVNLDNSIQYTVGWRAQDIDPRIGNQLFMSQGDYKFPEKGDVVTNRIQDLIEFQGVYRNRMGFRASASVWKDFAYDDDEAKTNPAHPAFAAINAYPTGHYTNYTKRYFQEGGEILDAFVFANTDIAGTPIYAKAGRLSQYWGNAFFFGFSNIAYSQSPVDYIKGFSQPGSEIKELFLPRKQILLAADLTPELSVAGQYFFEYRANRYPEAGTYLGFFDILFDGPPTAGALSGSGITQNDGMVEPEDNNHNWGLKVSWAPEWAGGDMGFYYRRFDEVHPWLAMINPATFHLQNTFAEDVELVGVSYERAFGLVSTGFELSQRRNTALVPAPLAVANEGPTGKITNFIANALVQLGDNGIWDSGLLIAELSYTRLNSVTGNANLYHGVGEANCVLRDDPTQAPASGGWRDGCATKSATAVAVLFDPQWLQVFPSVDIDVPISYTLGINGNPAYAASRFYAKGANIYSIGVKATYRSKHSVALQYNGYRWRPGATADNGLAAGLPAFAGFGGNGATALNDRGWWQLTFKSSF